MWMTPDGVTHCNAHANPRQAVTAQMWRSLVRIAESEGESSAATLDAALTNYLEDLGEERLDLSELGPELEGEWIPDGYVDGEFGTSAEVCEHLASLPVSWRMDAYYVVSDILDDLTTLSRWQRLRRRFQRLGNQAST